MFQLKHKKQLTKRYENEIKTSTETALNEDAVEIIQISSDQESDEEFTQLKSSQSLEDRALKLAIDKTLDQEDQNLVTAQKQILAVPIPAPAPVPESTDVT